MYTKQQNCNIKVRISPAQFNKLKAASSATGLSFSELIRQALDIMLVSVPTD